MGQSKHWLLSCLVLGLNKALTSIGIGVIGLAFGFAFQDIAGNFFLSGIILAFNNRPFKIGKS
jgi:small conductance mechanosensitive channel